MTPSETSVSVVYKYRLKPAENVIEMPGHAELLHVGSQGTRAYVWACVQPSRPMSKRRLIVVPTGVEFIEPETSFYLGTFTIQEPGERELIFHVFDCGVHHD